MTDKPTYEELEQLFAEAKEENKRLKKKSKSKESYAQKHVKLFEKFFLGKANLNEFPRESRSKKTESAWQYFFIRNGEACFQYKSFILDMIEAYCLVKDLPKQRESMMRYELKKALSGKTKKPGQTDEVKTRKVETPPVVKKAEDVVKATQATFQSVMKTGVAAQPKPQQKTEDRTTPQLLDHYRSKYGFPAELASLYDVKADEWFQQNSNVPVPN